MADFLVGAVIVAGFFMLVNFVHRREIKVRWWQWLLTFTGFCYVTFVLETIIGFLHEGAGRAALVNGVILGTIAVVWGVLLGRFVFTRQN